MKSINRHYSDMRRYVTLIIISCSLLNGCALYERIEQQEARVKQSRGLIEQTQEGFESATKSSRDRVRAQRVEKPWLMGRAVALAREVHFASCTQDKD